ncbi:MAG: FAD-dependent monooxygenase, partial [Burkholderiales bacterium]
MNRDVKREDAPARCEVLVHGGGPVGLACALWLARRWHAPSAITVLSDAEPSAAAATRALALSEGTRQLLARVIGFPARHGRIDSIEVSLAGEPGKVLLDANDQRVAALGYVVRYGELWHALRAAVDASGVVLAAREANAADAWVTVHAEGDPGERARARDFDQCALVTDVAAARPIAGRAFERFTREGPLALLPLPEPDRYSVVWCAPQPMAQARTGLDDAGFAAQLHAAFGTRLGALQRIGHCAVVPLARRSRRRTVRGNEVWIGNAAQTLHPVAGQGLNLGMRDAFELAECLAIARSTGAASPADALAAFSRARARDRDLT